MNIDIKIMLSFAACLFLVGCGGETMETVQVSGILTMDGKPLDKVQVTFMPDKEKGSAGGQTSVGETDGSGKFQLAMQLPKGEQKEGALTGPHKIVLQDLRPNDSRDIDDMPKKIKRSRINSRYTSASTTDLTAEIEPGGPATVDLEVKWK